MIKGLELLSHEEAEMTGKDKYLVGGSKEDRDRHLSAVPSDRTRSKEQKLKYRKFHLNIAIFFCCEDSQPLEQVTQRGCGVSILGDIQDPTLALSNCSSWCCSEWGLDWMLPRDAFQPQSLCGLAQVPQTVVLTNVIMW